MKVFHTPYGTLKANATETEISSAVETAMDGYCGRDGSFERLEERVTNHARFVGELVAKLCERGTLDAETLEYLLGSDFKVSP